MVALAGAFAFIVPYGSQAVPDTVISARPEILRIARELEFVPIHPSSGRYEIAATVVQAISTVESAMDDVDGDTVGPAAEVHARMATRSLRVARAYVANRETLRKLTNDFRAELKELGADERWIADRLARLDTRIGASRMHGVFEGDGWIPKRAEPEVKRLIEIFEIRPQHKPIASSPMSTWEAAVALNAILTVADRAIEDFDREAARLAWDGWGTTVDARAAKIQKDIRTARRAKTHAATLIDLVNTFAYELDKLGVDVPGARKLVLHVAYRAPHLHAPKPGEAYSPFPDVPQGHWAAKSIQNLRMAGILRGQPNGTFGK